MPPPPHTPEVQRSPPVHGLPSSHALLFALTAWPHAPSAGAHVAVWQVSATGHTFGFVPMHTPPWHTSVRVHALLSLHDAVLVSCTQALFTQRSVVHGLPSLHARFEPQTPPLSAVVNSHFGPWVVCDPSLTVTYHS